MSSRKAIVENYIEGFRRTLQGKRAFDAEIENDGFQGGPASPLPFVFCEVFTFRGDAVSRLDTYHLWLS